jgi:hypothetical protein
LRVDNGDKTSSGVGNEEVLALKEKKQSNVSKEKAKKEESVC